MAMEDEQAFDEGAVNMEYNDEDVQQNHQDDCQVEDVKQNSKNDVVKTSFHAKLPQLLRNLASTEFKIHSEASKEFIKLLRGDSGGDLLYQYVQSSKESCSELLEAWKLRLGKPGVPYILSLISQVLSHPEGLYKPKDFERIGVSRRLDDLANIIIEKRLEDIYSEIKSKDAKRQSAALSAVTAIVRRGGWFALKVLNSFDFKLPILPKLAEFPRKEGDRKSTRPSFIEFAMSFLEIGNPKLITRVLHLRDIYFGVLRELGRDDEETVVYVLSTLRDRVLTPNSLVTPALRSVLFGSVTLEQLISISGDPAGGTSAKIAHEVLVMVCTDPSNGLMPDLKAHANQLKGNPRRLLDLMKKLRATEITYHRDLLLSIVQGRHSVSSAYMDEFPYPLEPRASSTWFSSISLVSDLVSSTNANFNFGFLFSQYQDPPSLDIAEMQCLLKCIIPRVFSRIIMTRGLLHSDVGVRHGSMRLLLESLKSLDNLIDAIDCQTSSKDLVSQKWMALKQKFLDEARALLPDSQVLYKLLSSLSHADTKPREKSSKRSRGSENLPEVHPSHGGKKLKSDLVNEDVDLIISGVTPESDMATDISNARETEGKFATELESEEGYEKVLVELCGLQHPSVPGNELKDAESYFHSKLLDALTLYLRTMPMVLDGSFDFFKILPSNPFTMSVTLQQSLLSLLIEYVKYAPWSRTFTTRASDNMYKHLHPLLDLLIYSPVQGIKDRAYVLVRAAMLSTGLFDRNCQEIDAWLLFLPGYRRDKSSIGSQADEVFKDWSKGVSFLCDVVSTAGNSLYKYMDHLRCLVSNCEGSAEVSPDFSPLFICTLRKCLRLLDSDTGTFKLYEKTIVSMYVSNTLNFILQTQVNGRLFSSLIDLILTERFGDSPVCTDSVTSFSCEWWPLKNLLLFSRSIFHEENDSKDPLCQRKLPKKPVLLSQSDTYQKGSGSLRSFLENSSSTTCHSLNKTLHKTKRIIRSASDGSSVGVARAFCSSIVCASPDEILREFPSLVTVSSHVLGANLPFLASVFFHDVNLIGKATNLWPDIFLSSLESVVVARSTDSGTDCAHVQTSNTTSSPEEGVDLDSVESTTVAFSSFLKQASFHVLFPAIIGVRNSFLLGSTKLIEFLQGKISEGSVDDSIVFIRLILFWAHQIQSSYRLKPLHELEQLSGICFILIKDILDRYLVLQSDSSNSKTITASTVTAFIQEIAETIFHHPAVTVLLSNPLCCNKDIANGSVAQSLVDYLSSSKWSIHPFSHEIIHLLTNVADHLLELGNDQNSAIKANEFVNRSPVKAFKILLQQVIMMFRDKFKAAINCENLIDLLPSYHVLRGLIYILPPLMLLELVDCVFECCDSICLKSVKVAAFSIGCDLASSAFDLLSNCVHQLNRKTVRFSLFMEEERKSFYVTLVEKIYVRVHCCAINFKMECADLCLLKAVRIVYKQKFVPPQAPLLPSSIAISRMIMSSPINLLSHCIQGTTATKAKLLFLLTEVSPLHLTFFGKLFSCVWNKDQLLKENTEENSNHGCTDEQFMMLLPVALSYLNREYVKLGVPFVKHFQSITTMYSKILLDGFLNYKNYTFGNIFQEEYDEMSLSSAEELFSVFRDSLLGKAINMLQYYFSLNVNSLRRKKRVKLFNSICPCSGANDNLFDIDVNDINVCSFRESVNLINRIMAKIYFCRMLLFPKDNLVKPLLMVEEGNSEEIMSKVVLLEDSLMMRFIGVLISTLHKMVRRFPLVIDDSLRLRSGDFSHLFRYLEIFILRNICEVSVKLRRDVLVASDDTILEQFARSSFLHRFEDPITLKVLGCVLVVLGEGKSLCSVIFELLLSHSKFLTSLLSSSSTLYSSDLLTSGILMRPMASVLKSSFLLGVDQSEANNEVVSETSPSAQKLAVIKLLRVLYNCKSTQGSTFPGEEARMNPKELLCLLMSCYGATVNEIDLEIFDLMNEIVSSEASEIVTFAEMDNLWGSSALKLREKKLENNFLFVSTDDCEEVEECRRQQFRENLVFDSKICAATITSFPYDRVSSSRRLSFKNYKGDELMNMMETSPTSVEKIQVYDPAFILRFSIYSLSMSYLDPMEFVGLGLLAIAFMSISSPDEGIRKLGYETLGRFKNSLESFGKRKDGLQLQLLLTSLQNGIVEPWQKIPSFTAIFAADASFMLLDPKRDHYDAVTNVLEQSKNGLNLKCIPLFHQMFGSISVNSKACRLWILQLSYAGLNSEDDARIFVNTHISEFLLSFYTSSLSDYQAKMLILQVVKKSIKLPMVASYLVQQCNLISWLSSVLSSSAQRLWEDDKNLSLTLVTIVLEVANVAISVGSTCKWLKEDAFEQLSELSSNALKLFMEVPKMNGQNLLDNLILQILVSVLRISQERDFGQPHFTISYDGLFQLYQVIEDRSNNRRAADSAELGLKAILMSTPPEVTPHMDTEKLLKIMMWGISIAYDSHNKEFDSRFSNLSREECEDSLISKLLRWLTASVIRGRISWKYCNFKIFSSAERSKVQTLQTLLEHIRKLNSEVEFYDGEVPENEFCNNEALAATVVYLQQLLGMDHKVLPSVISAVCLLLLSKVSRNAGKGSADCDQLGLMMSLCSKIRCPAESNPAWRWEYHQPWKDTSSELTDVQILEEQQACEALLVIFSNALRGQSSSHLLSHQEVEESGVFMWERNIVVSQLPT